MNLLVSSHLNFPSPLLCPSPACPTTPACIIIMDDIPVRSPPSTTTPVPSLKIPTASSPTASSSPHSHDGAQQEFTKLQPTLIIPQAILHK
ncbi:hypothetical protein O181_049675 [Austropuccinia psidii MF-1]|uniref:Uncharacterized protein n=1 Tax=Austropuccinia psidii MF-1 TaxID=1389203 RepID=A0A9Q3DZL7_9BASI|nr:hypothetical protein [Austropuccinia psidii MF-1]